MTITTEGRKPPVYLAAPSKDYFFAKPKLGIGFVPNGACTNDCVFCRPNVDAMQKVNEGAPIITPGKFSVQDYLTRVDSLLKQGGGEPPDEIVITGVIGEPLLYYKNLLDLIRGLKKISALPVRLNTNGQAALITRKPAETVAQELNEAGLDTLAISLDAINENDYNIVCQPKLKGAFQSVLDFIKAGMGKINTVLTFVDYAGHKPEWPILDKDAIHRYAEENFHLPQANVIFRPYMTEQQ